MAALRPAPAPAAPPASPLPSAGDEKENAAGAGGKAGPRGGKAAGLALPRACGSPPSAGKPPVPGRPRTRSQSLGAAPAPQPRAFGTPLKDGAANAGAGNKRGTGQRTPQSAEARRRRKSLRRQSLAGRRVSFADPAQLRRVCVYDRDAPAAETTRHSLGSFDLDATLALPPALPAAVAAPVPMEHPEDEPQPGDEPQPEDDRTVALAPVEEDEAESPEDESPEDESGATDRTEALPWSPGRPSDATEVLPTDDADPTEALVEALMPPAEEPTLNITEQLPQISELGESDLTDGAAATPAATPTGTPAGTPAGGGLPDAASHPATPASVQRKVAELEEQLERLEDVTMNITGQLPALAELAAAEGAPPPAPSPGLSGLNVTESLPDLAELAASEAATPASAFGGSGRLDASLLLPTPAAADCEATPAGAGLGLLPPEDGTLNITGQLPSLSELAASEAATPTPGGAPPPPREDATLNITGKALGCRPGNFAALPAGVSFSDLVESESAEPADAARTPASVSAGGGRRASGLTLDITESLPAVSELVPEELAPTPSSVRNEADRRESLYITEQLQAISELATDPEAAPTPASAAPSVTGRRESVYVDETFCEPKENVEVPVGSHSFSLIDMTTPEAEKEQQAAQAQAAEARAALHPPSAAAAADITATGDLRAVAGIAAGEPRRSGAAGDLTLDLDDSMAHDPALETLNFTDASFAPEGARAAGGEPGPQTEGLTLNLDETTGRGPKTDGLTTLHFDETTTGPHQPKTDGLTLNLDDTAPQAHATLDLTADLPAAPRPSAGGAGPAAMETTPGLASTSAGAMTFQQFVQDADIQFLDHLRRGTSMGLLGVEDPLPTTLQECYQLMSLTLNDINVVEERVQLLKQEIAVRKEQVAAKEERLTTQNPAVFTRMANAGEEEASDLRNDLHQLKRCCRQQTALTWKEWRAESEQVTKESYEQIAELLRADDTLIKDNHATMRDLIDRCKAHTEATHGELEAAGKEYEAVVAMGRTAGNKRAHMAEMQAAVEATQEQIAGAAGRKEPLERRLEELRAQLETLRATEVAPSPDDMAGLSQELAAKVKNSEALMAIANNGFLKPALDGCTLPADRMKLQAEHIFQKRQEDLGKELEQCRISFPKLYRMAKQPDALTLHFMDMGREFWLSLTLGTARYPFVAPPEIQKCTVRGSAVDRDAFARAAAGVRPGPRYVSRLCTALNHAVTHM